MSTLKNFFLFCSGIDISLLEKSPSDENKFIGIGATIFFTGLFAMISGGYALFTVFDSYLLAIFFGLIWGLMIFNLDRYIVGSLRKRGSFLKDSAAALPRIALAILLAFVIAKPLELKIFEKEINGELVLMEQDLYKEQETKIKERFKKDIDAIEESIDAINQGLLEQKKGRDELALIALQEADGTGGSKKRNMGPIYRAKKEEADKAAIEYAAGAQTAQESLAELRLKKNELEYKEAQALATLQYAGLGGLASRLDALGSLADKSKVIWYASIFITLLFITIECAPILVKLISFRSPYDFVLHELEHEFEMAHTAKTNELASRVTNKVTYEVETSKHRTRARINAEKALIDIAIAQKLEELKSQPVSWKDAFGRKSILDT